MKILVYEDLPAIAKNWSDKIRLACSGADVVTAKREDFLRLLKLLNHRRTEWRNGRIEFSSTEVHVVDNTDVIIIDYDLFQYSDAADTTGSRLAYLLRCFTECGIIIVLNEYGNNVFDLKLANPPEGFADLNVGGEQIGNPGLWQVPFNGFRPWYWPNISHARKNFEICVKEVQDNLEKPIIEFLGLDRVIDWMPQRAWDFVLGKQIVEEITFNDFIKDTHGGIDDKDKLIPKQIARVAAARIGALLNSIILPDQSLLVDAPHLISRFPSLISGSRDDIETWNKLCNPIEQKIDNLLIERLKQYRFQKSHWLWRPAWYWPEINRDEEIEEVKSPWTTVDIDWVFCEDISRFVPIEDAKDFRALVSPPYIKRFVLDSNSPGGLKYVAQISQVGAPDPSKVNYVPQAAFGL